MNGVLSMCWQERVHCIEVLCCIAEGRHLSDTADWHWWCMTVLYTAFHAGMQEILPQRSPICNLRCYT